MHKNRYIYKAVFLYWKGKQNCSLSFVRSSHVLLDLQLFSIYLDSEMECVYNILIYFLSMRKYAFDIYS